LVIVVLSGETALYLVTPCLAPHRNVANIPVASSCGLRFCIGKLYLPSDGSALFSPYAVFTLRPSTNDADIFASVHNEELY
jgi:hypothetical protein